MRLDNKIRENIDFSRGIDNWNRQMERSTSPSLGYEQPQPFSLRPTAPGRIDDILNMVYDEDGKLIGRNPVTLTFMGSPNFPNTLAQRTVKLLTHPAHTSGKDSVGSFLVGTVDTSTVADWKFFRNGQNNASQSHTYGFDTGGILYSVYYNNYWWIFASNAGHGIVKLGDNNVKTTQAYTQSISNPISGMTIFKDRAWQWGNDTILWSKATDPGTWTVPDGGFLKLPLIIRDVVVNNDQLYILTTDSSLYVFSYSSDPATDGVLTRVIEGSTMPGAGTGNLCVSNGQLFTAGTYNVYQIINNTAVAIGDDLHLNLNGYTTAFLWDCGKGLLLRTYYAASGSDKTQNLYFYSYSVEAWTRMEFPVYANDTDTAKTYLYQAHLRVQANYVHLTMIFENGADVNNTFAPVMDWWITYPNFDTSYHDRILNGFDGSGTPLQYRTIKHKLRTGPIYVGEKDRYKRFWNFLFDAYLGFRGNVPQVGTTPYRTVVDFVPEVLTTTPDANIQKTLPTDHAGTQYVISINQRARAVRFSWETEEISTWTVAQDPENPAETSDFIPVINKLELIYSDIIRNRFQKPNTALSDVRNY
jgi:hypothetical protein